MIDLSFVLFNRSWRIYFISKESKYTILFLSINNTTQLILILRLSSRFMTYAPSFILGKLSLENISINLGSKLKYLVISILLKQWDRTKDFYPFDPYYYILFMLLWLLFPRTSISKGNAINGRNSSFCPFPTLMTPFPDIAFINEDSTGCINEKAMGAINEEAIRSIKAPINQSYCFFCFMFYYSRSTIN